MKSAGNRWHHELTKSLQSLLWACEWLLWEFGWKLYYKVSFACCSVEGTDIELWHSTTVVVCRADSRSAPSQWETALLCNDVSHWLVASLESALDMCILYCIISYCHCVCSTTLICMRVCYVACLWNGRYSLVWFTQRGLVSPYGIVKFCHQWFRLWLRTCLVPSHYLNQCWLIANPEENVKISMKFVPCHPIDNKCHQATNYLRLTHWPLGDLNLILGRQFST